MKKMKKFAALGMIATLSIATLAGCGTKVEKKCKKASEKYAKYCDLGDYKGISYTAVNTEITDEIVEANVNSFLESKATVTQTTDGTAKMGDTVNIDFVGSIDGVEFEGGNSQGAGYDIVLGSHSFIDDFEDQIVGHKCGETFDVYATFPENYGKDELNGKEAKFVTTLNSISVTTYPELNDDFVAANTDYNTVDEYKNSVKEDLIEQAKEGDNQQNKSAIITAVIDNSTINEYPEQEAQDLINETIGQIEDSADQNGVELSTYVTAYLGFSSEESFRAYVTNYVKDFLTEKIVIYAIADAEGIKVSQKDIDNYKKKMIDDFGYTEEAIKENFSEDDLIYYTLADKVSDWLLENAVATETDAE